MGLIKNGLSGLNPPCQPASLLSSATRTYAMHRSQDKNIKSYTCNAVRSGTTHMSVLFWFRWLAPAAHEVALHALVCLLRAAEVDLCGHGSTNRLQTELDMDTVGGGRAVVMEEGVLLLVLNACAKFEDHGDVVKICCMLMRVGVMCALHGEGAEVRMARYSSGLGDSSLHNKKGKRSPTSVSPHGHTHVVSSTQRWMPNLK